MFVAAIAISGGGWWSSTRLRSALDELHVQKQQTDQHHYAASVALAEQELKNNHGDRARSRLAQWIPEPGQPDLRGFAWDHLWRQLHDEELTLRGHTGDVYCVRYSRDGRLLATASQDETARIWDAATGKCLFVLKGHAGDVHCVSFSCSGDNLATAGDDGKVCIWRTANGTLRKKFNAFTTRAVGVAYSPVVNALLASCGDRDIKLVNINTGEVLAHHLAHETTVEAVAYSADGKLLATGGDDACVRLWSGKTGEPLTGIPHDGVVNCLSFSGDGARLVTGQCSRRIVRIWDLNGQSPLSSKNMSSRIAHRTYEWVHDVAFDQSNQFYAVATKDGAVELVDATTDGVLRRLPGHATRVWSLSFSSDGRHLATASADRTVKIWDLAASPETIESTEGFYQMSLTPDGRTMAVGGTMGRVTIYDVATKQALWRIGRQHEVVGDFDGDGRRDCGTFDSDGIWRLRLASSDLAKSRQTADLEIEFGGDRDLPVVGDWDGDGRDDIGCYDCIDNDFRLDLGHTGGNPEIVRELGPCDVLPGSRAPVVGRWEEGNRDGVGVATFAAGNRTFRMVRQHDAPLTMVVQVDEESTPLAGRWHAGRTSRWGLWNRAEGLWLNAMPPIAAASPPQSKALRAVFSLPDPSSVDQVALDAAFDASAIHRVQSLAISPDGARIAIGYHHDCRLNVWDVAAACKIHVLRASAGRVVGAAFSPDGRALAMATSVGELVLYDAHTFQVIERIQAHEKEMFQLAYSRDGRLLATIGADNVLNIWNSAGRRLKTLREPGTKQFACLAFSSDSRLIAVGGADRVVRIWNVETEEKVASLAGHALEVTGVSFSPDSRCLATASDDGAIKLWDLGTWQELCTLAEGLRPFKSVEFAGGQLIAVGTINDLQGKDVAIQFWSAGPRPVSPQPSD